MISYKPLLITLVRKDRELLDLKKERGGPLNKKTVERLANNESVRITTLDVVCRYLDVPIEEVVEIIRE